MTDKDTREDAPETVDYNDLGQPNTEAALSHHTQQTHTTSNSYNSSCVFHFTRESASRQVRYPVFLTEILDLKSYRKRPGSVHTHSISIKYDINSVVLGSYLRRA